MLAKSGRCLGEIQIYHDLNSCSGHVGGLFPVFFCTQCFADDLVKPPSDNKPLFFWRPLQSPPLSINMLPCTPAGQGKAQWDPWDPHPGARGTHEPCALCWHRIQSLPSFPKERNIILAAGGQRCLSALHTTDFAFPFIYLIYFQNPAAVSAHTHAQA